MIQAKNMTGTENGSFFCRWEPRYKLIGFFALILGFAFVQNIVLLPVMLGIAILIYSLSSLPISLLLSRLRLPGLFLLVYGLILVFGSGQTELMRIGPLVLKAEGSVSFLIIAARLFSIFTMVTILFASTPLPALVGALQSLGMPSLLAELLLYTYSYIFQLVGDLQRTRYAARLRGFQGKSLLSLQTLAYIVGTLLVRSHAQSERVFQAMTLRGYGQYQAPVQKYKPAKGDRAALALWVLLGGVFVLAQMML